MLFLELPIINLSTKRIKTEMLFKLSNLNSNLALTLGYLNPALNNWALVLSPYSSYNPLPAFKFPSMVTVHLCLSVLYLVSLCTSFSKSYSSVSS